MIRLPELDDAVQDLSEGVGRRLIVLDASMRVISYSIHESRQDRERLSHVLAHSDTWPAPNTGLVSYSMEQLSELGDVLFVRLVDSAEHIIGHLMTTLNGREQRDREINPADLSALQGGVYRLSRLLETWRQDEQVRSSRVHQRTLKLISGDSKAQAAAAEALFTDRMLSASDRYCAVALGVDPRDATQSDHEKATLAVSITLRFVNDTSTATVVGATLDEGIGVLVFPRPVVVSRLTRILKRSPLIGVQAGIGPLSSLENLRESFERARIAWRAAWLDPQQYGVVNTWDGLGIDRIYARLPLEHFTEKDLPESVRRLLSEVDSPILLQTLDMYLVDGGEVQQTAQDLGIHRSTLYYRLDKLKAIIQGDLNDGLLRRELHSGLRIARLAGLLPFT